MAKTLLEYADWLEGRNLVWPAPPRRAPVAARPSVKPLPGLRGVAFSVYGTLLRITDGQLVLMHPHAVRMEIALEKVIKEFSMWNSMTRKPGAPSAGLLVRYGRAFDEQQLAATHALGDYPEIDATLLWKKLVRELEQKQYTWDQSFYGDLDLYCEKIAYFFHGALQGTEAEEGALATLSALSQAGMRLAILADAQRFTSAQMLRALRAQGTLRALDEVFDPGLVTESVWEGIRKPSRSLYRRALDRFRSTGIAPGQVLYVGTRLRDDVAIAKEAGMRTALLAADQTSLSATREEIADPELRPDRLLTRLDQLRDVVGI
jgi:FMN phosphatase YigB (HAD superfamily)